MISNIKLAMMLAATKALEYKKEHPDEEVEEMIKHIMHNFPSSSDAKVGAIAAANKAIKYKRGNPKMRDKEIVQMIADESDEILKGMSEE
jgi:hypothetical protein